MIKDALPSNSGSPITYDNGGMPSGNNEINRLEHVVTRCSKLLQLSFYCDLMDLTLKLMIIPNL